MATAGAAAALHAQLERLNPGAERASFPAGDDATMALVHWVLERRAGAPAAARHAQPHRHGQLVAVSFSEVQPLLTDRLHEVIEALGERLIRAKGFVHLAGEPRRGFFERAGARTTLRLEEPWGADEPRTELVLIGEDLDEGALRRALWAARAALERS